MTKKAKVPIFFFRPTVLHDHAASRLVKKEEAGMFPVQFKSEQMD